MCDLELFSKIQSHLSSNLINLTPIKVVVKVDETTVIIMWPGIYCHSLLPHYHMINPYRFLNCCIAYN